MSYLNGGNRGYSSGRVSSVIAPPPDPGLQRGTVPSFSVVIAAYQAAEFVGDAVASALEQSVPPREVIVCDDGSTDDIAGALEPYRDRIQFLRQENRGEAGAKNAAARAASGEFISILDADDLYLPERLELVGNAAAARPDLDVLTTRCYVEIGGEVVGLGDDNWRFVAGDQRAGLLESDFVFGNAAVRRTRFEEVGGFDESIAYSTDWDLWLRMVFSGSTIGLVDRPLATYRLQPQSMSTKAVSMAGGAVQTLENAERSLPLTSSEREALERSLGERRGLVARMEAQAALLDEAPDARRLSRQVALGRGHSIPTRLKAAMGAVSPAAARRFLRARERRSWHAATGMQISPLPDGDLSSAVSPTARERSRA
jgi:hypothetical protein